MSGYIRRLGIVMLMFVAMGATLCYAQFNVNITGTVTDPNRAVVANVQVSLRNVETGVVNKSQTNGVGLYRFLGLVPGHYVLTYEAPGFAKLEKAVRVTTNEDAGVDVSLKLASATETITVATEVNGVNTEETRIQNTLQAESLASLPISNRSLLNIVNLAPGVTGLNGDSTGGISADNFSPGGLAPSVSANGLSNQSNLYTMDDVKLNSDQDKSSLVMGPNPDSIDEVAIQTNTFSVEHGSSASMQTAFTTKSGKNAFHGDLDYDYTSKAFTAYRDFAGVTAPFKKWFTSGALGGPIVTNRTFFFGSYQNKNSQNSVTGQNSYISPEFATWAGQNFTSYGAKFLGKYLPTRMHLDNVTAVATNASWGSITQTATGCTLLGAAIPCGMNVMDNGTSNQAPKNTGIEYNTRLDQYFRNGSERLYLNFSRFDQKSDFLQYDRPGLDAQSPSGAAYMNLALTSQISNYMVNFANVAFTKGWSRITPGAYEYAPASAAVFGPSYWQPAMVIGPDSSKEHQITVRDYLNIMHGRHNVKIGGQFSQETYMTYNLQYARPWIDLFFDMTGFLQDSPFMNYYWTQSATTGLFQSQVYGAKVNRFGVFGQDEWKVRPNLTLTFGVRFDDFGNPSKYGDGALPYASLFKASGKTFKDQITNVSAKLTSNAFNNAQTGFMPRVGFNWSPLKSNKLSVRGGMGLYMDGVTPANVTNNLPTNPPNRMSLGMSIWGAPVAPANPFGDPAYAGKACVGNYVNGWERCGPFGNAYPQIPGIHLDAQGAVHGTDASGNDISYQASLNGIDRDLKTQKTVIWNFGFEQELPSRIVAGVMYSGSHSYDQNYQVDYNYTDGVSTINNEWGHINYMRNGGYGDYNALIISARQQNKLTNWQASYTVAQAKDTSFNNSSNILEPYLPISYFYGASDYDVRNRLTVAGTFRVPSWNQTSKLVDQIFGNWELGAVVTAQSGTPFMVYSNENLNGGNPQTAKGFPALANGYYPLKSYTREQYKSAVGIFTKADFDNSVTKLPSTQPRNIFRNPGYFDIDANLTKKVKVPWFNDQKASLAGRFEILNVLNRANLGPVDNNYDDANFGKVVNAYQGRVIQLGARFEF